MYEDDISRKTFSAHCSLPFGDIYDIRVHELVPNKDSERVEIRELPKDEQDGVSYVCLPEPWSKKKQKEQLILEEQRQKEREDEIARRAQAHV